MIYVDNRVGSVDLADPLRKRGLPVEVTRLEYGDVMWLGNGPEGLVPVGMEVKTVGDLLSCIANGRFAGHQLPGLQDSYQYIYFLTQGRYRAGDNGELLVWKGAWREVPWGKRKWLHRNVAHWLTTMRWKAGIELLWAEDRKDTLQRIHDEYTWWTADEWAEHRAHLQFDRSRGPGLLRPSAAMKAANLIDGIGWDKAALAAQKLKTPGAVARATVEEWMQVDGIGKVLAEKARRFWA